MERIKQALEKARQERRIRQGGVPVPATETPHPETGKVERTQTRSISVEDAVLRENRIAMGVEPGPFTDAYNLLRTQVLQRFKENNWNVLAVTSPGEGEGKTLIDRPLVIFFNIGFNIEWKVKLE